MSKRVRPTRTRVARVKAEYPNHLDYIGVNILGPQCKTCRNVRAGCYFSVEVLDQDAIRMHLLASFACNADAILIQFGVFERDWQAKTQMYCCGGSLTVTVRYVIQLPQRFAMTITVAPTITQAALTCDEVGQAIEGRGRSKCTN